MQNIIGIDVGTTSIKCSSILPDGSHYNARCNTPSLTRSISNNEEITFSPKEIWNALQDIMLPILKILDNVTISIVCQGPSLCFWDQTGEGIGISYLSYYGNPKQNNYIQRKQKTNMRLALANYILSNRKSMYVSGLTGYIVFMLTGELTLDSITAWELGIESQEDLLNVQSKLKPHIFPSVLSPLTKIPLNCAGLNLFHGFSIVGATDSAILPISITPEFSDYYVYLGSWGSLLESKIKTPESYEVQYHTGLLNNWLISIPDFISKVTKNIKELDNLFVAVKELTFESSKIAICGGLTKSKREYIQNLIDIYFEKRQVIVFTEKDDAFGSCRLAKFANEKVKV